MTLKTWFHKQSLVYDFQRVTLPSPTSLLIWKMCNQPLPPPQISCGHQVQLWLGRHFLVIRENPSFLVGAGGGGGFISALLLTVPIPNALDGTELGPINTSWMNGQNNCYCFH